jgi:HB1, ASXL, restriction endonuclease HTH domain
MNNTTLTTKAAIEHVMKGKRRPMTVREIIDAAVPLSSLKGKTPGQVIYSVLYSENKKDDGLVTRTGKGQFKLNPKRKAAGVTPAVTAAQATAAPEAELFDKIVEVAAGAVERQDFATFRLLSDFAETMFGRDDLDECVAEARDVSPGAS